MKQYMTALIFLLVAGCIDASAPQPEPQTSVYPSPLCKVGEECPNRPVPLALRTQTTRTAIAVQNSDPNPSERGALACESANGTATCNMSVEFWDYYIELECSQHVDEGTAPTCKSRYCDGGGCDPWHSVDPGFAPDDAE